MSWKAPIANVNTSKMKKSEHYIPREEVINVEEVMKTTDNVVMVGEKFVCPTCNEGWTFNRFKTIVCCGITFVRGK